MSSVNVFEAYLKRLVDLARTYLLRDLPRAKADLADSAAVVERDVLEGHLLLRFLGGAEAVGSGKGMDDLSLILPLCSHQITRDQAATSAWNRLFISYIKPSSDPHLSILTSQGSGNL